MDATVLRPLAPSRFRRVSAPRDAEAVLAEISTLVAERQVLRAEGASEKRLERNRLRIARLQWELSYALIGRHGPAADAA